MSFATSRKNLKVSTYSKVMFLLITAGIGFMLLYAILFYYTILQQKQISNNVSEQFDREINALIELNSDSYTSLIGEMTFWDELVNFVETKDLVWFNSSISYLIDTNKVDYIDTYNLSNEFVAKVANPKITSENFIPKEIFPILYNKKIIKFNIKLPEGYVQVYGATIHPSEDPFKNKTKPRGYIFMIKLIDSKYFDNLEKISNSRISFYDSKKPIDSKFIYSFNDIKDYSGKKIASLVFKRPNNVNFSTTKNILGIIVLGTIIGFIVFFYYAKKWSKSPIKLITNVLKGDTNSIQSLKKIRGEFRYIGKLFEENHNQKLQLQKSKAKIEESDNLKSAFLMNLSHEIRTPMNAIIGFSDLLSNEDITKKDKIEYINIIKSSGRNLIDIIDDLVEMSRLDTNLVTPNLSNINLENMIQATFDAVSITNNKPDLDFKLIKPNNSLKKNITTDVTKLNQILVNMLDNALKFTDEGFVILDYDIDEINKKINFEIKDSGIGIPDDFKTRIFKRFSKTNTHSISANEGLGLGLAISKAYIDMLGGQISVQSQEGIGTTFKFWIPLKYEILENGAKIESSKTIALILDESIKILVAEDDNVNFMLIKQMLKSDKIQVIRAVDGQQAIEICKENNNFDMIFMDIRMPNKNGHEAFESIREFNPKIPIVAQTSYSFPEEIDKIVKTGFNDYISKPLDKNAILGLVEKHTKKG
jgi:signal transduction histidine kinase/ActR/RegA family two-component response regulator